MTDIDILKAGGARIFVQALGATPANPYEYYGALTIDSPKLSFSDPDPVYLPSSEARNQWEIIDEVEKAQSLPSADFTQMMDRFLRDAWWSIARRRCRFNVQITTGTCNRPDDFNDWDGRLLLKGARLSGDFGPDGPMNAMSGDDNAVVNLTGSLTYRDLIPLVQLKFSKRGDTVIVAELKDGLFHGSADCGDCGPATDGTEKSYYLAIANGGSPGLSSQIIFSLDGENTFTTIDIPTLGGLSGDRIAAVGNYLVVISQAALSHHVATFSDINDGIQSWAKVSSGYVATKGPRAIWSKNSAQSYVAAAGGYIYLMTDPTSAVTPVTDGSATTQDLNDIDGIGAVVVAVGNNNAVLVSSNNGDSFGTVTGPVPGVALNAVSVIDENTWYVGTANGRLYFTINKGKTWTVKAINSALTAINDIQFVDDTVGYLVAQEGSNARVYSTLDSGNTWQNKGSRWDAVPAAERYNFAAPVGYNKVAIGGRITSAGDGQLVVAS